MPCLHLQAGHRTEFHVILHDFCMIIQFNLSIWSIGNPSNSWLQRASYHCFLLAGPLALTNEAAEEPKADCSLSPVFNRCV